MYKYDIDIKSGTGKHFDEDGCDLCVAVGIETPFLPRVGETISLAKKSENKVNPERPMLSYQDYLVRDVNYWINGNKNGINVYVIPA